MRLDLADLRLFLNIVDAGSITRGAERSNLALASASERIKAMESDVGVALLERRARGVVATDAGDALIHHARLIVRQQALLKSELENFATGNRGAIELLANTAALTHFLPGRLASWLAPRPELTVVLRERTSVEIVDSIASGVAEAGIVSDAMPTPGLQLIPVAEDHLKLIVARSHALAARTSIAFEEVAKEPFVALADGNALQQHIDEQARAIGHALRKRISMKTFEGVCDMVEHGVGLGILPSAVAERATGRYSFHALEIADAWANRRLGLCYRSWNSLSVPMQSLLKHLSQSRF